MECFIGDHDLSSEPVRTLVMPSNAETAALKKFVRLEAELPISCSWVLFGSMTFLADRAGASYRLKGGRRIEPHLQNFAALEKTTSAEAA
jgi:hypothetical protein